MSRKVQLHIEGVPNPDAIKIVLENGILVDKPYEFKSLAEAEFSPLARRLLMFRYVQRVMLNQNYITILKEPKNSPSWQDILFEVRSMIQQHLESDQPIIYIGSQGIDHSRSDDVIVEMVRDLLDKHIRPAAQEDGGDIVFDSYANGVLNLTMHGACHKCPYANQTMKTGVEPLLTQMMPEIRKVTATANNVI
ncbi:MAG: NifU family protein [Bacteroidia bacterium]|nr:NifU family protein [Bacteroidia bacterium]